MKGELLTKSRKLVKGLAKAEPAWLKAMEQAPRATFPCVDGKVKTIKLPEDVYIKKFFHKYPESLHHDAVKISGYDPVPAHLFGLRVLELKEQGVREEDVMAIADEPPPNPYPSAIKEIQEEEKMYVHDRFHNPKIRPIVEKMKEERQAELQDRYGGDIF